MSGFSPTDSKPCLCGCGQEVEGWYTNAEGTGWKSGGVRNGFADESHFHNLHEKHSSDDAEGLGLPTFNEYYSGKTGYQMSEAEFKISKYNKSAARLDMLGFTGEAERQREKAKKIEEKLKLSKQLGI